MRRGLFLTLVLALGAIAAAHAFGIGQGNRFGRHGAAGVAGTPPTPSSCTGTIDLSAGCALPMLGGAP